MPSSSWRQDLCNDLARLLWCLFKLLAQDAGFVRKKYKKTYQEVVDEASSLNLSNLGLNAELAELGPTLDVCKDRLRILDLSRNAGITGTLDVVSMCENLETLKLAGCDGLTGTCH